MKNLIMVPTSEVWEYWRSLEGRPVTAPMRTDIIDETFPVDTVWFEAEVDQSDIDRLFMIRVPDFATLSKGSWKIRPAAAYFAATFAAGSYDGANPHNAAKMRSLLAWPARRTTRAIIVSDNENGPLTILDGNHRLVLLQHENALVGAPVYLGLHAAMGRFSRAVPSYTTSP